MKRLGIAFVLLLTVAAPSYVYAQETQTASDSAQAEEPFDYQKAYQDYVYKLGVYQKAESEYKLARSQYIQAKTLASQTRARDATVSLLQSRDDVMATYLTALRMKLGETEGVSETEKEGLYSRIDSEIFWYLNHKSAIPSAGTLADLVADSNEAKAHFDFTEPLVYEVLATMPAGRVGVQYDKASDILNNLKVKVAQIRSDGEMDTSNIERGLLETEQKLTRSLDKRVEAQQQIADISNEKKASRGNTYYNLYTAVVNVLRESNQFTKEASKYMSEIVKQIKTAS